MLLHPDHYFECSFKPSPDPNRRNPQQALLSAPQHHLKEKPIPQGDTPALLLATSRAVSGSRCWWPGSGHAPSPGAETSASLAASTSWTSAQSRGKDEARRCLLLRSPVEVTSHCATIFTLGRGFRAFHPPQRHPIPTSGLPPSRSSGWRCKRCPGQRGAGARAPQPPP